MNIKNCKRILSIINHSSYEKKIFFETGSDVALAYLEFLILLSEVSQARIY